MLLQDKVVVITGGAGINGLGFATARLMASQGARIAVLDLPRAEPATAAAKLGEGHIGLEADVTDKASCDAAVASVLNTFGRIDVLVNNAGYGLAGAIEEVSTAEARTQFDTNVFGLLDLTQRVLPTMRAQKSGVIVNLSSLVGHVGMPGIGIYSATKFAVEGISEALAAEVAPLGIRVLLVEPGPYRTKFNGSSLRRAQRTLPDYAGTAHETLKWIDEVDGKQPGDPELAVALMIKTIGDANAPFRLPLGQFAIEGIRRKLASVEADVKTVEQASLATDRPAAEQAA